MALNNYGFLKGHAITGRVDPAADSTPYCRLLLSHQGEPHRVSANIQI